MVTVHDTLYSDVNARTILAVSYQTRRGISRPHWTIFCSAESVPAPLTITNISYINIIRYYEHLSLKKKIKN